MQSSICYDGRMFLLVIKNEKPLLNSPSHSKIKVLVVDNVILILEYGLLTCPFCHDYNGWFNFSVQISVSIKMMSLT